MNKKRKRKPPTVFPKLKFIFNFFPFCSYAFATLFCFVSVLYLDLFLCYYTTNKQTKTKQQTPLFSRRTHPKTNTKTKQQKGIFQVSHTSISGTFPSEYSTWTQLGKFFFFFFPPLFCILSIVFPSRYNDNEETGIKK